MTKPKGAPPFTGYISPKYTQIPDLLFDEQLPGLSGAELKVLLYLMRRTFGFKKDHDNVSLSQIMHGITTREGHVLDRGTGLSRDSVTRAIKSLEQQGLIFRQRRHSSERGDEATTYALNVGPVSDIRTPPPQSENRTRGGPNIGLGRVRISDTQETVDQQTVKQETDRVVVVREALERFGITAAVAEHLTKTYPEGAILEKLDLVQWLVESRSPLVGKNPAGYLRRAIEADYTPPPTYRSPTQRQAAAQERDAAAEAAQRQQREAEAEYAQEKTLTQQRLRELYPPTPIADTELTTREAWEQALDRLHGQLSRLNFETWLANTALVQCDDGTATIAAPSRFQVEHLATRLQPLVARSLGEVVGTALTCTFVPASELLAAAPDWADTAAAVADAS